MKSWYALTASAAIIWIALGSVPAFGDEDISTEITALKGKVEGMDETLLGIQSTVDALSKIKVSGYIQSQFQVAQSVGVAGYSGGNFPSRVFQRFQVRRGRLKVNYINGLSQYVIQFDVSQNGLGIKDAYLSITDPFTKALTLTTGAFDRPFGFEISYSSSQREAPERSRMYQILFPNERDLGAKIEYNPERGALSFLRGKVGVFNGNGIPGSNATVNENDNHKDLIGRIGVVLPMVEQNMEFDGGVSFYMGASRNQEKYLYAVEDGKWSLDSTATNKFKYEDRSYIGVDAQYYADLPVIGGMSFRGEFITGKQPSHKGTSGYYNPTTLSTSSAPTSSTSPIDLALYKRNVSGYYLNYVQNVGLFDQIVLKYDSFDPNADVEGSDVGKAGANLTNADLAYNTLGFGWVHYIDSNVKATIYYDMVTNEKANVAATGSLSPYKEDLDDNVLTIRMQYKF